MEDIKNLVIKARSGDLEAYGEIVRRFQAMAHGFAYSFLGDFHLAEDVAQESFLEMYRQLPSLRNPEAFSAWFRRILIKNCDRITRGKQITTVSLDAATA
ncbi:MAG: RNA polymerase sigma factor, partial [Dehalococcoidales bacterium]|nr:RNA polymerase sigma factor [Dehalococcoidales bacterium]